MKEIAAWGCSYCGMSSRRKASVTRHEIDYCRKNPHRVSCAGCVNFTFEEGTDHGEMGREPSSWWCEVKEVEVEYMGQFNTNIICSDFKTKN